MTDEPKPEDILEGKNRYSGRNSVPPLQVINETRFLEDDLGKVLLGIYELEEATLEELSDSLDLPRSKTKRNVTELRKQGYLGVNFDGSTKLYYVASDWSTQEFPSGPIIPLVYQYNLLSDQSRMEALHEAIQQTVDEGDVVADLGAGVGFLSCIASETAEKVYAVEIDREVYEQGEKVVEQEGIDNIEYIRGDAREIDLPENVDVVLCELLDTGLIAELQVPVMNYAIEEFSDTELQTVPHNARTSIQLIESNYEFYGNEFRIPHFEEYDSRDSESRSKEQTYHEISFQENNSELVEQRIELEAKHNGIVNGIQINTEVKFAPGMKYTGASPWLNPPLNLPFDEDLDVEKGELITVDITYELGGGLSNIVYNIVDRKKP